MSNYVQTTFFTPKDSLPPTNPAKTIFGAAYDVEFGNIASAIATKIDATSAVTGISGTANQISASSSIGNVTLSFPLNIVHPAPVSGVTVTINGTGSTSALQVLGTGVQLGSPTGGDQGAGSINASNGFFVNGVAVVAGAAAAGSLTGTTLASNVVTSSLTALGTLGSLTISGALTGSSIALGGAANEGAGTINATGIFLNGTSILSSISANSLTGTTLAAGVVNSSLTSVGTLSSLAVTGNLTNGGVNILQTGSYTGTLTGCTTSPTATVSYTIVNNSTVTITIPGGLNAISNTASCTLTGGPSLLNPLDVQNTAAMIVNGGNTVIGAASYSSNTITLLAGTSLSASGFGTTLAKGFGNGFTMTYSLKN